MKTSATLSSVGGRPLVSVIIPCYNRSHYLSQAVSSTLQQKHRPLEILIIDDGSTDGTFEHALEIVEKTKAEGVSIQCVRQENAGAPAARNRGLALSKGKYIQYLDSDDVLLPDKISAQLQEFDTFPETDIIYSRAYITDEHLIPTHRFFGRPLSGDGRDLADLRWQTMCSLTRRGFFETSGNWDESIGKGQEFELAIRSMIHGAKIRFLDRFLAAQRAHGKGHMGQEKGQAHLLRAYLRTFSVCLEQIQTAGRLDEVCANAYFLKCANLTWAFAGMNLVDERNEACILLNKYGLARSPLQKALLKISTPWGGRVANRLSRRRKWLLSWLEASTVPPSKSPVWDAPDLESISTIIS